MLPALGAFRMSFQSTWTTHREKYFSRHRTGLIEWIERISRLATPSANQRNEMTPAGDCGGWRRLWFFLKVIIRWPIHAWTPYIIVESGAVHASLKSLTAFDELFASETVPSLHRHFQIKDPLWGWWWHLRYELIGTGCCDSGDRWPTETLPAGSLRGVDGDELTDR